MKGLFEKFPEIYSEKITLKALSEKDAPELFKIYSDPEVVKYIDAKIHSSTKDSVEFIKKQNEGYEQQKGICWGIFTDNELAGVCRFYNIYKKHNFLSIGYELRRDMWHKGIMTDALHLLLNFAFKKAMVNRIEAQTYQGNHASVKILEKLGFTKEGELRENFCINGVYENSLIYSLLKKDIQK